ncbi:zf-HC2 domain-containing protein [Spiractinospora alimapuensis]|uniref:zf-HC2 domain-containing protein n=1 Tax=Spiractinospora alimapuensis TaxID=2820884 RepID=UPI001F2EB9A8|nr:zf-HC2 domain-containing protein [Spiractinospora alimapuensis]QVQ50510.1 zf-HC2 domain-containing protein [Spiractinospora alimapuensis]
MTSHVESVALGRYVEEPLDEEDASMLLIALYHEGALEEDDAAVMRSHIAECAECDAALSGLEETASLLRTSPSPPLGDVFLKQVDDASATLTTDHLPSLPPSTAQALDERLAAEFARGRSGSDGGTPPSDGEDTGSAQVLHLTHKTRFSRWTPMLVAAAAAVFVVGGGIAVLNSVLADKSAEGPAVAEPAPQDDPEIAQPYKASVESGTAYTADAIDSQVSQLIDSVPLEEDPAGDADTTDAPPAAQAEPEALAACTAQVVEEGGSHPFLVDLAEYEGVTAWVLVDSAGLPPESTEEFHYRVVADTCGAADSGSAEALDSGTVSAP